MAGAIAMDMLDDQHRHHRADLGAGSGAGTDDADGGSLDEDGDEGTGRVSVGNREGGTMRRLAHSSRLKTT